MNKKTLLSYFSIIFFILIIISFFVEVNAVEITVGENNAGTADITRDIKTENNEIKADIEGDEEKDKDKEFGQQTLVTIMFFETDLREALNEISLQTGINIIADQTVSGIVTADLQGVPLEKALRMVLISGGYTFKKIDDFYFIGLPDIKNRTFEELSELEVVKLHYINAEKIIDLLPGSLEEYVEGDRQGKVITINAPQKYFDKIMKIINKLDRPKKQVEVKVLVTEIDSRYLEEFGADLFNFNDGFTGDNELGYDMNDNLLVLQTDVYGKLLSKLKILKEDKKATIEADPRVLLTEGETAELFIGDSQILLLDSEDDDIASRIEKVQVGVALNVKAVRISNDNILLNIAPELSHFIDTKKPDLIIKESSVNTTVSLKDGQTIALAGMTMTDQSTHSKKVPVLSDIPILRWLFSSEKKKETETELLVFVTPVIR